MNSLNKTVKNGSRDKKQKEKKEKMKNLSVYQNVLFSIHSLTKQNDIFYIYKKKISFSGF